MSRSIIWSTRAFIEYEGLIDYLLEEWNEEIALRVSQEIDTIMIRIQTSPEQFPFLSKSKNIQRAVMSPQT